MSLETSLVKEFAKMVNSREEKDNSVSILYGTAKEFSNGYGVQLDGSVSTIPLTTLAGYKNGDRIRVKIENNRAMILGSENAGTGLIRLEQVVNNGDLTAYLPQVLQDLVTDGKLSAVLAQIDTAYINKANIGEAQIDFAHINDAFIGKLTSDNAFITNLKTDVINSDYIKSKVAEIGYLEAESAFIKYLQSTVITAEIGEYDKLLAKELSAKYASIDLNNVKVESVSNLLVNVGVIKDATIESGHITGYLDAVKINAESIDAGTLAVDRLIIKGSEESIMYALNKGSVVTETITKNTLSNYLHGEHIVANSITATQIAANTITAQQIDVASLFAENIMATGHMMGMTIDASNGLIGGLSIGNVEIETELAGSVWADNDFNPKGRTYIKYKDLEYEIIVKWDSADENTELAVYACDEDGDPFISVLGKVSTTPGYRIIRNNDPFPIEQKMGSLRFVEFGVKGVIRGVKVSVRYITNPNSLSYNMIDYNSKVDDNKPALYISPDGFKLQYKKSYLRIDDDGGLALSYNMTKNSNGNIDITDTSIPGFYLAHDGIRIGNNTSSISLDATGLVADQINVRSGKIANWTISENSIYGNGTTEYVSVNGTRYHNSHLTHINTGSNTYPITVETQSFTYGQTENGTEYLIPSSTSSTRIDGQDISFINSALALQSHLSADELQLINRKNNTGDIPASTAINAGGIALYDYLSSITFDTYNLGLRVDIGCNGMPALKIDASCDNNNYSEVSMCWYSSGKYAMTVDRDDIYMNKPVHITSSLMLGDVDVGTVLAQIKEVIEKYI